MEKQRRAIRTRTEWQRIVEDYVVSGLSAAAYCKRTGVSSSSLYKWLSRLKPGTRSGGGGFVPVRVVADAKAEAGEPSAGGGSEAEVASVELVLLSGRRLVVKGAVERQRLAQLIAVAEQC